MRRLVLLGALGLAACRGDALEAARQALESNEHQRAVVKLRPVARAAGASEDATKLYGRVLDAYVEELRGPRGTAEACDQAFRELGALEGFGDAQDERGLLSQALLCAARARARSSQPEEAARIVVEGMERLPGFDSGSPVLAKALQAPAEAAARAGKVGEATALAQTLFGSGETGLALSMLDLLEAAGASPDVIVEALRRRAEAAKSSDTASGIAAGYAVWRGHPDEAARWYDGVVERAGKAGDASSAKARRYASLRGAEAQALADSSLPSCRALEPRLTLSSKVASIPVAAIAPVEGGAVVAWVQGDKAPDQQVLALQVAFDGSKGTPVTVSARTTQAEGPGPDDPQGAFAPKNRETSLGLVPCGGVLELSTRGAPEGAWVRATLGPDASVTSPVTPVPHPSETARMPREDVWWSLGCSGESLVHLWLADTQLMRLAWFSGGQPAAEPTNVRLPGFAPAFEVVDGEAGSTLLVWVDIVGEGRSQIVRLVLPPDRTVPTGEEGEVAAEPAVEGIDGRVEQMRLERVGGRYAIVFLPQGGDLGVRWMDPSGRLLGQSATLQSVREDVRGARMDAAAGGERLAVAWTEQLTERHSALYFATGGAAGSAATKAQRIAGLVRPDVTPLVAGSAEGAFVVVWVDRSATEGESLTATVVRCGG